MPYQYTVILKHAGRHCASMLLMLCYVMCLTWQHTARKDYILHIYIVHFFYNLNAINANYIMYFFIYISLGTKLYFSTCLENTQAHSCTCCRRGYYYFQLNLYKCIQTQTSARSCTHFVQMCKTWGWTIRQTQTWTLLTNEYYNCWQLSLYLNTTIWAEHHVILVQITVKTCIFLPNPMQCFEKTLDSTRTQNLRPECHCLLCNDGEPDSPQIK
jgi:hypothetical protein